MSEENEREILNELKKMNEKLDKLNEPSPFTMPIIIVIGVAGYLLLAPFLVDVFVSIL
ncbi:hypothetical protein SAMN05216353_102139 [Halobacillus alkaliphilus]|uniref:Uncharacterized protein n=1 Tax=Halobacillus alkaliphilus TaxID=396056 RepID=A0A1I2JUX2_9BACI|nr:hypothetical protein [Halobacillus alkaliphilus]SFF57979.1 hypothetical protein SAMN05216353_102139 [Halobacillus alkaliphilus]